MPKSFSLALTAMIVFTIVIAAGEPLLAATCGPAPVVARGEPSRYQWLAKTKARANWRRKVRDIATLGPAYSSWGQAADSEERCITGPENTVCTFTGTPCKP